MTSPTVTLAACPVCDHRELAALPAPLHWVDRDAFRAAERDLGLGRCAACGFVFVNPRPSDELLDGFYRARDYAAHAPAGAAAAARRARIQLDAVERFAAPRRAPRLLDYGCGGGHLLEVARERGWDVMGFDVGAPSLAACRARGLPVTDREAELPDRRFDVITMSHVFEHVADPGAVLRRSAGLLAPGGALCLEVPNAQSLRAVLSPALATRHLGFDERYRAFPVHLSYFTPSTLRRALERHGFTLRGITTIGLGISALRLRPDDDAAGGSTTPVASSRATSAPGWRARVKAAMQKTFFDRRLGENLIAVASPASP